MAEFIIGEEKRKSLSLIISLIALIISFFQTGSLPFNAAWIAILLCGIPIIKEAVIGLFTKFDIKADVLVSLALLASVLIGEIFAAGEVAFIMAIGGFLEERTVAKARAGIEKLVHLTPTAARVVVNGEAAIVSADCIKKGDTLRVLAGETIPVDGIIVKGKTSINQSLMTGEPLPVDKKEGDEVYSGTVNQLGTFDMAAQKVGEDSSLQRMIRLVESADASKAKIVGAADRFATWIVVTALLSAGITWAVTGEIIRAVTILVVFCPCALVLATPTAIMAGIGNASKYGILIREGDALERLAKVTRIAFDKTGTLTYGKPSVISIKSIGSIMNEEELLELAAASEASSEHPLGAAIVEHYKKKTGRNPKEPEQFQLSAGLGVSAVIDGSRILVGKESLLAENHIAIPSGLCEQAEEAKKDGSTVIYLSVNEKTAGFMVLSDTIRAETEKTITAIHNSGKNTLLLTGDASMAAACIAQKAGIKNVQSDCMPEDKLGTISDYQNNGELICMVGDGINDAPALKTAYVGIAMGGIGSDIAIDASDIVLVGDDMKQIPHLLQLSKKTMKTIHINLGASMLLNFVAIVLAITGILNPIVGALVHNFGSVAVIINSALLLKWKSGLTRQ